MVDESVTVDELVRRLLEHENSSGFQVFKRNGKIEIALTWGSISDRIGIIGMGDTFEESLRGVNIIQDDVFEEKVDWGAAWLREAVMKGY